MKKISLVSTIIGAVALLGCEQHNLSETVDFASDVTRVDIQLDSSEVEVIGTTDTSSSVDYDVRYRGSEPSITAEVSNGTLKVRMKCRLSCDGDFIVKVPSAAASAISVDSGNMSVSDLEGDANLTVDSGNIHVSGLSGRLSVDADSGSISGSVESTVVDGTVDSGNVDIHFEQTPTDLDFSADSGSIDLEVPEGAYDVHASVDSGKVSLNNITVDSSASSVIYADVDSGNISIKGY